MSFFQELKRRNVFRVGIAYAVGAWLLLQLTDVLSELLDLPSQVGPVVVTIVLIGFPVVLFAAWAYELTPEGIKRESDVDRQTSITPTTGRRLDRAIIALLVLVLTGFLFNEYFLEPRQAARTDAGDGNKRGVAVVSADAIAVLPFDDFSQGQDQGWFADGLAEEILNSLTRIPELKVSSRTASFRYRGSDLALGEIAAELDVDYVLEGSVRSSEDRIRVTAQLIRAADGIHLWSDNYDREPAELISIQEDLAQSIAEALELSLDPEALAEMSDAGTRSIEAYQAYLKGITLDGSASTRPRQEVLLDVRDFFEQATDADPTFGEAWYRLADWWLQDLQYTNVFSGVSREPVKAATDEFNRVIDQAIEHAANRVDRNGYRAMKAEVAGRLWESVDLYADYVESRPNQFVGWNGLMNAAMKAGDTAQLLRAFDWLREDGRKDLRSATVYLSFAYQHENPSVLADYGLERLAQWPDEPGLLYQAHRALLWAGRVDEAAALARRLEDDFPNQALLELRQACAEGRTEDARAIYLQWLPGANSAHRWLSLKILGQDQEATAAVAEMIRSGLPLQYTTPLIYRIFDPSPFPVIVEHLRRENIERPPPLEIPFRCRAPTPPSVAVLPFANMSPDPDNEYFSDGISEELLNLLVKVEGLRVPSRTSSFAFKNQNTDIREIARQLQVAHILEGSVRKADSQVRITAQLIDVSTDSHLWSETYDRELEDIFAIQDEIASEIVGALQGVLGTEVAHERPTDSLDAYNAYLQGLYLFQQRGNSLTEAERLLRRAVELDPGFVEAWATLGLTLIMQPNYEDRPVEEAVPLALEAADRVDALRPDMAEALMVRGNAEGKSGRYASAMREYQRAVDLHPEHSLARLWYAITLLSGGYLAEAEGHLLIAQSLDPASGLILDWLGRAQVMLGKPEPAAGNLERAVRFNRPQAIWGLGILTLEGHVPPDRFAALVESAGPVFRESARLSLSVNAGELPLDVATSRLDEIFQDPGAADYGHFVLSSYTGDQAGMIELLPVIWPRDATALGTLWYGEFVEFRNAPEIKAELERMSMVDLWRERGWPDLCRPVGDDDFECD